MGAGRGGAARARSSDQGREYELNPGDGTFYGPKIDFHVTDALGRSWQCGTCQIDFYMPERFDLTYQGADNAEHRPVMIHRALLGSMERFVGILIEHHGGRFPVWLAPTQAVVLPVADRHNEYASEVAARAARGGRARAGSTSAPSRSAEDPRRRGRQVPYMLVVGDRELEAGRGRRSARTTRATSARCRAGELRAARAERDQPRVLDRRRLYWPR